MGSLVGGRDSTCPVVSALYATDAEMATTSDTTVEPNADVIVKVDPGYEFIFLADETND